MDLEHLARIDPNNDIAPGGNVAVANKRPRLTIKLNASRRPTSTDDDDDGNGARGGGVGGCSSRDRAAAGFPRTREEYIALLRGAERLRDANTTRRLAEDMAPEARVDVLVEIARGGRPGGEIARDGTYAGHADGAHRDAD